MPTELSQDTGHATNCKGFFWINEWSSSAEYFKKFGHFGNKIEFFMDVCNRHGYDTCDYHVDVIRRRLVCSLWTFFRTGPTRETRGSAHDFEVLPTLFKCIFSLTQVVRSSREARLKLNCYPGGKQNYFWTNLYIKQFLKYPEIEFLFAAVLFH